ncbi:U-box domain-containing protein 44-like [Durio zibethinus]|uniref:RING-type E3 ubiquitin transferase n=1 Tax=Durio zibethinus TaxID=66656 RepID=A0A6P5YDL2_DURZI|nr:U-box domain-containing protein 44-like [Durio zibethinus]
MMAKGITTTSLISLPELFSQTILAIFDCIRAAKSVLTQMENFEKFSNYMEKITLVLKELSKSNVDDSESLRNALDILNLEVKVVKQLALECGTRNKLMISCRKILKQLENSSKEISQALSLIPLDSVDGLRISNKISRLCKDMLGAEYSPGIVEDKILEKNESGIQERNVDRCYANDLLVSVAEAVGVPDEQLASKKEFEEFKTEIEDSKLGIDTAEAPRMKQNVVLLEKADAITSYEEKAKRYLDERNSLGMQLLQPLQSFYCPITMDVMVDPVEISSGRTFERSAIERWFADGNKLCPSTSIHLDTLVLQPNKTLRQSIEEWKDRNKMITIVSIKPKLQSNEEQEVLQSLCELQDLCAEQELHREWVTFEGNIPILIGLLSAKNREIRTHALAILCILAKDSHDNKERIAKVDHAFESIVRSLARQIKESKLALQLLLELSRSSAVRDVIGTIQGCIFLVVTMLNSDDDQASGDSRELLDNLSFLHQNVIEMAKANFFKPLLQLLSAGPDNVRLLMAKTLSEIELTDHHKLSLFKDGALGPLLQLLSHDNLGMKTVAVRAFQNLSNLPQNGLLMIKEGALGPLFEILYCHSLSSPSLREQVAVVIMHLAKSTNSQEAGHEQISLLESDEDIFKLFSLVSLTGPEIQRNILQAFCEMCQSSSGRDIRAKLRQLSAVQVLVQLCEVNNQMVRTSAVKLFYCLTVDGDDISFQEHVGQRCIGTLLRIIKTLSDEEEAAAAMGIISNLPKDIQITQWLLDSGALDIIFATITDGNRNASHKKQEIESAVRALCRFTVSINREWQKKVAEAGFIPVLVQLLVSGTCLTKQNAAVSLKQFSESSTALSHPVKKTRVFICCLAAAQTGCPVHRGICTVESSFCILEANAVEPLVRILGEGDLGACEASLDALLTLIDDERLQSGCQELAKVNAIPPIIKLLSSTSTKLQEKALGALERIFRTAEMKQRYATLAQMPLVDIAQRGSGGMKSLAAKVLAQLNVLGEQSSYF